MNTPGSPPGKRLAVDVGGTFVDFVLFDEATGQVTIEKVPSSGRLEGQFFAGLDRLDVSPADLHMIVHGSTLVINTVLQENGARVGLITTQGFRDVLELGRGNRAEIYNLFFRPPPPLVPRYLRYEVPERINRHGEVLLPLDEQAARRAVGHLKAQAVAGIAICLLHAHVNPAHERRLAGIVAEVYPEAYVSISSDIVREWREFERTSTTVLNAYAQPRMAAYLSALQEGLGQRSYSGSFNIMQSSGGMTSMAAARVAPIRTLQSGPAGGVIGAARLGAHLQRANLVSADVGGTSFDVALIVDGRPFEHSESAVNRRPVLQPTIDIVSIGAGGGSMAWIDKEGGLRVGPHSAEANPGPACFGLGGGEPTVTDAQLLLGYLDPNYYLGGRMTLDRQSAEQAIRTHIADPLGMTLLDAASGIVHLTNMNMTYAMRKATVERGHDPRDFDLICFGGGGGLFAGALLRELEMARAIVPVHPAAFSAWGLLSADFREDVARTLVSRLAAVSADALRSMLAELEGEARASLQRHGAGAGTISVGHFADMRYVGQEHTVRVPIRADDLDDPGLAALRARFDLLHDKAYAHALPEAPVEIVHLRVSLLGITPKPAVRELAERRRPGNGAPKGSRDVRVAGAAEWYSCPVYDRDGLDMMAPVTGPAIVEEWTATTLVPPGQQAAIDRLGNLVLAQAP